MTIKELIDSLSGMAQAMPVLLASDAEGNEIRPLDAPSGQRWDGEDIGDEEDMPDGQAVVVLWPKHRGGGALMPNLESTQSAFVWFACVLLAAMTVAVEVLM